MRYPGLFSPITVGNLKLKNRIIATPASTLCLTPEGYMNPEAIAYYELKAKGGAAAVTLGESITHRPTGKSQTRQIAIDDDEAIPGLMDLVDAVKRHGAAPSLEFAHGGKHANVTNWGRRSIEKDLKRYGPVKDIVSGFEIEEMPEDVMYTIAEAYADCARRAKLCGFEMILVHGGHGWLLHQFLSRTNTRKDQYGGEKLENRARFPLMLVKAVRDAVGPNFPIEFRMSGAEDEYEPGGYDIKEGIEIAQMFEPYVNIIEVSAGNHEVPDAYVITHPGMFDPLGRNVHLAAEVKKHVNCAVATVGALGDPDLMEKIIQSGKADIVGLGRSLLCDPFLPKKAWLGKTEEITKCMRCFTCTSNLLVGKKAICPLNPEIGRELEWKYPVPKGEKKKVAVIGAGPAGMECVLEAVKQGHEVTLVEKSDKMGGSLNFAQGVPFKQELYNFSKKLEKQVLESGAKVLMNTEADAELIKKLGADVVVAAVGAEPIIPKIPGYDRENVVIGAEVGLPGHEVKGDKIVIIGGGLVGCEAGINLAWQGKDVTVVEMMPEVAGDMGTFSKFALMKELRRCVKIRTGVAAKEISDAGVTVEDKDGNRETIPADTVVMAVGMRSLDAKVEELRAASEEFYVIGDAKRPRKLLQAISDGLFAARDIGLYK